MVYDLAAAEKYIRQAAAARGIDPDVAVAVARSEGLREGVWQSNVVKNGRREPSYGPFQLYTGGGLGNEFMNRTGLDPADPNNLYAGIDFALDHASKNGWGSWYGARDTGIPDWAGIGTTNAYPAARPTPVSPAAPVTMSPPTITSPTDPWRGMSTVQPAFAQQFPPPPTISNPTDQWDRPIGEIELDPDPAPRNQQFIIEDDRNLPVSPQGPSISPNQTSAPAPRQRPNWMNNTRAYRDAVMPEQRRMAAAPSAGGKPEGLFG
jgi:hypothetical protein